MMPLDCGCTVVQKTHEHFNDWANAKKEFAGRVIFVIRYNAKKESKINRTCVSMHFIIYSIRNPYDTIVSCWKYLITADHLKHIPDAYFFGDGEI